MRSRGLPCVLWLVACAPTSPTEATGTRVTGGISTTPTVVSVQHRRGVTQPDGSSLEVLRDLGSGILLCPTAVLTAHHVVGDGGVYVSNELFPVEMRDSIVYSRWTWRARHVLLKIPKGPASVQVGPAAHRLLASLRVGQYDWRPDGLAVVPVDPPFPANLPYPGLAPATPWAPREDGSVLGFAPFRDGDRIVGYTRRLGTLPFAGLAHEGEGVYPNGVALAFTAPGGILPGDSGGPLKRGPLLAGVTFGDSEDHLPGEIRSLFFDVTGSRDWLRAQRDAMCPPPGTWAAPREGPSTPDPPPDPRTPVNREDAGDGIVELAASDETDPVEPDEVVCVCDGPCEESCPSDEEEEDWFDQ